MSYLLHRLRVVIIAFAALALSAGLAFGAQPDASLPGLANASTHAGKTVPVKAGQVEDELDEDVDAEEDPEEDVEEDVDAEGAGGENCATDPTDPTLTEEELAALKRGSIVCWAAHQVEWPAWFKNHGKFVSCWAHSGKADAPSCTEDPNAVVPEVDEDAAATSSGHGKGQDKGKGKGKGHNK